MTKRTEHYKYASTSERLKFIREEEEQDKPILMRTLIILAVLGLCVYVYMLWRVAQ